MDAFKVHDGDEVHIFPIAPYNEDAIYIQGHVLRPGRYSYKQGMSLSDLIGSLKICCLNLRRTTQMDRQVKSTGFFTPALRVRSKRRPLCEPGLRSKAAAA